MKRVVAACGSEGHTRHGHSGYRSLRPFALAEGRPDQPLRFGRFRLVSHPTQALSSYVGLPQRSLTANEASS